MDDEAVRREVLIACEYSYIHEDWVYPLAEALKNVTVQEATWNPDPNDSDTRCIWQIISHMSVWTENIVKRMEQRNQGIKLGRPLEGAWPPLPNTPDEAAWNDVQQRLWNALAELRVHIETVSPAALLDYGNAGYSHLADLLCRLVHNAYHIGQITKLREWYAAQMATV